MPAISVSSGLSVFMMFTDFKIKRKIKQLKEVMEICKKLGIKTNIRDGLIDELDLAYRRASYPRLLELMAELDEAVEGME